MVFLFLFSMFIDTHTHLYSSQFDEDRDLMIERAFNEGVEKLLLPNVDSKSIQGMMALQKKYPTYCYPMMGLHPCSVDENWEDVLKDMRKRLDEYPFIAVGEIGIDLYWDKTFQIQQEQAFIAQIKWAKELDLPIVIHARDSFQEIFKILDHYMDERLKGVFHCFTGNADDYKKIKSYENFFIGIGGVVTFKKSGLDEVLKQFSLSDLVLETDAPYLAPTPFRGKRNESAYLPLIASKLSDIFEISEKEVARITTENAKQLFRI